MGLSRQLSSGALACEALFSTPDKGNFIKARKRKRETRGTEIYAVTPLASSPTWLDPWSLLYPGPTKNTKTGISSEHNRAQPPNKINRKGKGETRPPGS